LNSPCTRASSPRAGTAEDRALRIGVISDTHGLVRPEALRALQGSELIVHAGDVGHPDVLTALEQIAPVVAVRGNNDRGEWARRLRETETVEVERARLFVIHDVKELDRDPAAHGFAAVIAGHSHRPNVETRDGVLFFNPGSAGPRRFSLPLAVGRADVRQGRVRARIILLSMSPVSAPAGRGSGRAAPGRDVPPPSRGRGSRLPRDRGTTPRAR
jgi:putative phosphoesterase